MRLALIVNTTASSVTPRGRVVILKALSADHDVEVIQTTRRGHAGRIARGAAQAGAEVVVVIGGDGTLNEAADGLAGTNCALAPLPGGSTNVYARAIGVADDPIEATGQLLQALSAGSFTRIGLGVVNGRRFLFHAGVGFDAAVVHQVERRSFLKRHFSHPLYVASAFTTWLRHYDRSRPRLSLELPREGAPPETLAGSYLVIVSKTDPYTYLGRRPLRIAPQATLDSLLTVTAFRSLALGFVLSAAASALRSGRYLRHHPLIVQRSGLRELVVRGHGPVPYQVDGDYLGETEELRFSYEPDALTLVLPAP